MADRLAGISVAVFKRYHETGRQEDIDDAILIWRGAMEMTQINQPVWADMQTNLGAMLATRYEKMGDVADLEEAIQVTRQALSATSDTSATLLRNLGQMLENQFKLTGNVADLEEAIRRTRQALDVGPVDNNTRATWSRSLSDNLMVLFHQTEKVADLEKAVQLAHQAVDMTPEDHPLYAARLDHLGQVLEMRYERFEKLDDLEAAVQAARKAVSETPDDHPGLATSLNNLGNKLETRYERLGDSADLEEAIQLARQASSITEDANRSHIYLHNLGFMLGTRYEQTGNMADLEAATGLIRQAVETMPEGHRARATYLDNLGIMLSCRYERLGHSTDLEEAIEVARQAVSTTSDDKSSRLSRLSNLAHMLQDRHERTANKGDLEEGIRLARQAVHATPDDHSSLARYLDILGNGLISRYDRVRNLDDLEEAVRVARQAVDRTPEGHISRIGRLNNLAGNLRKRYEQTGEISDLEEAIRIARQVLDVAPEDDPSRALYLHNLGIKLKDRYERTENMTDLEEAIQVMHEAVGRSPEDWPSNVGHCNSLAEALLIRFKRTANTDGYIRALILLHKAWSNQRGNPFDRVSAAAAVLSLCAPQIQSGDIVFSTDNASLDIVNMATQIGKGAVDLLHTMNIRLLDRGDQQYVMSTIKRVTANLCATLLSLDRLDEALQYLENGRAVILSLLMDSKSDLSVLAQQHPDIAKRYEELRKEVSYPARGLQQDAIREQILQRRRQALSDLDNCVQEIRTLPGYERFLLGQTTTEMQECAAGGSIVIINITIARSDAIIVSQSLIKSVNLSSLSVSDVKAWLSKEWNGRRIRSLLAWLWRSCVKQVLSEVRAIHDPKGQDPLRVWWIGVGLASSLPFHAAGIADDDTTENAYSQAISSYVPSIKALAHARKQAKDAGIKPSLLLVTMPTTPQMCDLNGVIQEKDKVLKASKGNAAVELMDCGPGVDQVMEGLQRCSLAHFACHGVSDSIDPSSSGLILQKMVEDLDAEGVAKLEQDRLTVRRVSDLDLRQARVAFLSACSTAENATERLSDEVIHVVSGFQVAGFPHVIGSLWPAYDEVCVEVTDRFYSSLFENGGVRWGRQEVASALRIAVMAIRKKYIRWPIYWAQYVHYGP